MLNLKKLLTKILTKLTTTTTLVPLNTSLFSHYATSDHLQVSKCGDICHVIGIVKNNSAIANGGENKIIGTIPEGYRPTGRYIRRVMQGSGVSRWLCTIRTDGAILIDRYSNTTANISVSQGSWLIIDIVYNCNMPSLS